LKENFDASPPAEKQFAREASILFNLRHPNLPMVFDYFSVPGQGLYLVMVYVEGEDLQQLLERRGEPLPEADVLPWVQQVCDALSYLHSQEPPVIHRDIKPANIKITPQGQAVLVDFGIAKVYDPHLKTTVGARAVTPGYSPPEQYGRGSTDARTDIYALGATLYALLTGAEPPDSVDLLAGSETPPAALTRLNPKVSMPVENAIKRAMQLDREQRFQSVADFKTALLAAPPAERTATPLTPAPTPGTMGISERQKPALVKPVKRQRKRPRLGFWPFALVILVALALVVGIEPSRDWLVEQFDNIWGGVQPEEAAFPPDAEALPGPEEMRFDVPLDQDPLFGPRRAPVTLVEFGDFGSEGCQRWHFDVWPRLLEAFGDQLRLFYLDYPQEEIHPNAFSAALAANCAMEQGRYWEYHDRLFSWEHGLGLPGYYIYAEDLGFDMDPFRECFESERFGEEIQRDLQAGRELGVEVTPTFFINGIRVDGVPPFDVFVGFIERELQGR
jgi:hypothetical protein